MTSSRAFPSAEPSTSTSPSSPVVVINFHEEGSSTTPQASLVVVQAPVGDASAAVVAVELARAVAESAAGMESPVSELLLAALRLPPLLSKTKGTRVFWGGNHEVFSSSSSSSSEEKESLPRDARISDGFISALALSLSLSLGESSWVALAAVDGHRPAVTPLFSSSSSSSSSKKTPIEENDDDLESLDAASALGEAAAAALGLKFSREKAARLVPTRAALLEGASISSSSSLFTGVRANDAATANAPLPPQPLLQGAELMYG